MDLRIAEAVKAARVHRNLNSSELDRRAGLPRGYIYKIENSLIVPGLTALEKIARGLQLPLWMILRHEYRMRLCTIKGANTLSLNETVQ